MLTNLVITKAQQFQDTTISNTQATMNASTHGNPGVSKDADSLPDWDHAEDCPRTTWTTPSGSREATESANVTSCAACLVRSLKETPQDKWLRTVRWAYEDSDLSILLFSACEMSKDEWNQREVPFNQSESFQGETCVRIHVLRALASTGKVDQLLPNSRKDGYQLSIADDEDDLLGTLEVYDTKEPAEHSDLDDTIRLICPQPHEERKRFAEEVWNDVHGDPGHVEWPPSQ